MIDPRDSAPVDPIRQIGDGGDDYAERESVVPQFNQPGGDTEPAAKRGPARCRAGPLCGLLSPGGQYGMRAPSPCGIGS